MGCRCSEDLGGCDLDCLGTWQEYVLDSEGAMATCMREAALLCKVRHPNIAQVVAVFEDPDPNRRAFFIQMPYYPYGQLEAWIEAYAPRAKAVRSALKDVLSALVKTHGELALKTRGRILAHTWRTFQHEYKILCTHTPAHANACSP